MPTTPLSVFSRLLIASLSFSSALIAGPSLGLPVDLVAENARAGAFPLVKGQQVAPIFVDSQDFAGVIRAAGDLRLDVERVTGKAPELITDRAPKGKAVVIAGTIGQSALIDGLIASGKLKVAEVQGQWESFIIVTVDRPMPGVQQALVVVGSDPRGTIYGLYEISEQIGVSPWYWWADVAPTAKKEIFLKAGRQVQGPPAVQYRGIFINDEEPALGNWSREKFGGVNSKMYAHMYELILRMRGNYLWPAMWGKSLYEDDPESARLAHEYGIVMGTSHHEPMMRAHKDWTERAKTIGNGQWNYATNEAGLKKFFREGIERNRDYETLITIGMRGDGDEPMAGDDDMPANIALLEKVVADQRQIIGEVLQRDVTEVPQVWALYKEVADYYAGGMQVPDDVALLWCDDNWGNIRRLPTDAERTRTGGAGIYYHFDYVGSPRSYKWTNTNPLPKVWQQMQMAHSYGANRIWIVNVGDLKPMEVPIEFFLRLAWNPEAIPADQIDDWTARWAEREFGSKHAAAIADLVAKYAKYNGWRKPELLTPETFSFVNYGEAERVEQAWDELVAESKRIAAQLPKAQRDAYFQLVGYPVEASATVAKLYLAAGRNRLYAAQGRASALAEAELTRELFAKDQALTDAYHQMADGKWNHMMAQTRIGYNNWFDPKQNNLPELKTPTIPAGPALGVAVEGSTAAWPGAAETATLPPFDSVGRQRHWIDVFRRGDAAFEYTASANVPWVRLSETAGRVEGDRRLWVEVDWKKIPLGTHPAEITLMRAGGESVTVGLRAQRTTDYAETNKRTFHGDLSGPIAINAMDCNASRAAEGVRWEAIPDYGRGSGGMTVFPIDAPSILPPSKAPSLEYRVLIPQAGKVQLDLISGVALNTDPSRGVRVAVSINEEAPRVLDLFDGRFYDDPTKRGDKSSPAIQGWHDWVRDNVITLSTDLTFPEAGIHTVKIWMVDPGYVFEKLVLHTAPVRPSYFGPVAE